MLSKPRYDWWSYVKAVIRKYPDLMCQEMSGIVLREKEAVRAAVEQMEALPNGPEHLAVIDMVFWSKTHTLAGAAMEIPCSYETAKRYQQRFIKCVAKHMGLLD